MFVDETIIKLKAGSGGNGMIAFRREKYVPMGGPAGGNGGKGADIIFKVDSGLRTLLDFQNRKIIEGKKGTNGASKSMHGKNAEDLVIKVPPGTTVTNVKTGEVICDLVNNAEEYIVAHGGRGGKGNKAFATHDNPAPNVSENGEPGEELLVKMELKLIADVGLVGLPSVGKSTLISVISSAKPKIAEYEFTTLSPNLGVVKINDSEFVVADLPGLIEGASKGVGLGDKFLKHIERTKVICHVIDMSRDNPYEDYNIIEKELSLYSDLLKNKSRIIVANKMDLEASKENVKVFRSKLKDIDIYEISAIKKQGLKEFLYGLKKLIDDYEEEFKIETFKKYEFKDEKTYEVLKIDNKFIVKGLKKLYSMANLSTDEGLQRFLMTLDNIGVNNELEIKGIEDGDIVAIEDFEFEYRR